jgi:Sensors of blue-light using FAD
MNKPFKSHGVMPKPYHGGHANSVLQFHRVIRLVYVSTCAEGLELDDVLNIVKAAQSHNEASGISGMLCWSGEFFLQCLEGERGRVSECYSKICADKRHFNLELIISAPTAVRWFNTWGMGFSRLLASQQSDLASSADKGFNPYLLEATDLETTFEKLTRNAQRLEISNDG